jgi:hypothetical protein
VATLQELLLSGSYTLALRALVLSGDLTDVLDEVPQDVLDGSVSTDRTRELRHMGGVTLDNSSGAYTPTGPSSLTWPWRVWRLERGAYVDGTPQYVPLMTGLLNEPALGVRSKALPFTLASRLTLANQQFSGPLVWLVGTRVEDVVRQVLELAGLGTLDALYTLDDGGQSLQAQRAVDVQDNMLQFVSDLAKDNALELYDNALGVVVLAPWRDPSTTLASWTFDATRDAVTLDLTRTLRAQEQVYNRAIVVGVGPDHYPVEAQARDLNPLSPTYNPVDGSGPVGDRPRPRYVSTDIHDQATANDVALRLLYEGALYEEAISAPAVPVPGVEAGQVAQLVGAGANSTYLLDTVSMPLRGGDMQLTSKAVRSLIAP